MAEQGRRWCFTVNNYSDGDIEVFNSLKVRSIIVGKEVGDSGTPHLQGFIKFTAQKRLAAVKKISPTAHWEIAKGTDVQNLDYCSKEEVIIKKGQFSSGSKGGGCSSMAAALDIADKEWRDLTKEEKCVYLKHEKAINRYKQLNSQEEMKKKNYEIYSKAVLKPWQEKILKYVDTQPHPRKVLWYVDEIGNWGKTWLSNYLVAMKDAIVFSNGKSGDIAYAYRNNKIVIFDFSRSQENFINYGVIEDIKNGRIFSGKYESCSKVFDIPHVICFSNFNPDTTKLSKDRWNIHKRKELKL